MADVRRIQMRDFVGQTLKIKNNLTCIEIFRKFVTEIKTDTVTVFITVFSIHNIRKYMERRKPIPLAVYKKVAERLGKEGDKGIRYIRWRIQYGDIAIIEMTATEYKKYKKKQSEQLANKKAKADKIIKESFG